MSARGLLVVFATLGGCGEIREVPVDPSQDETSSGEPSTDVSTSLAPTSEGIDESGTTELPPDLDTDTTTGVAETGDDSDVVWASFCAADTVAENPGDEIVIEIPVEDLELRSDFRIGMRVHETQAGLRASVVFGGEEVVLIDEDSCEHDLTAAFTDAGDQEASRACEPTELDEDRTTVPVQPLAPLIEGDIGGTWQLRFRSKGEAETSLVVAQTCVFVGTPG